MSSYQLEFDWGSKNEGYIYFCPISVTTSGLDLSRHCEYCHNLWELICVSVPAWLEILASLPFSTLIHWFFLSFLQISLNSEWMDTLHLRMSFPRLFFFLKQCLMIQPGLAWNFLCRLGCSWNHWYLPASDSQVLR